MELLYKTYSISSELAGKHYCLAGLLYKASVRSGIEFTPGREVAKAERKRILNKSLAACAETSVVLEMIRRANVSDNAVVSDLKNQWEREQRRISGSMNKLKSDE